MANYTVQLTAPAGNYPFDQVRVSLTCDAQPQQTQDLTLTPSMAVSHVFDIANGTWRLKISGIGFVPVDEQNIVVNGDATNAKNLTVIYYTLHTDRDRDGVLDAAGTLNQLSPRTITFGTAGRGAIIPVNCNRDGNNAVVGRTDNQDQQVNGNSDLVTGVARFEIRRTIVGPVVVVPAGWELRLWLDKAINTDAAAQRHFRIFDGDANNSLEIIGPETADEANITTASVGAAKAYGIEAVRFAGQNFTSGQGIVSLFVIQPEVTGANNPTYMYGERIVAARWIGNHHRQTVSRLYVADAGNAQFRTDLGNAAAADNPAIAVTTGAPRITPATNVTFLNGNAWANYAPIGETVPEPAGDDRWMRDTIVSGLSSWPGNVLNTPQTADVFMKTHRWRSLQNWVFRILLDLPDPLNPGVPPHPKVGVWYPAAGSADAITSANSGGNIAVTPPVQKTANGIVTPYRYGRIYYGHNRYHRVDASSRDFMAAQNMQTPIILDTDWLLVGHVDEMMTFVPDNNPGNAFKKWKLLVASPAEAYRLMTAAQGAHGAANVLNRAAWDNVNNRFDYTSLQINGTNVGATINALLGNGQAPLTNPRDHSNYTYKQLRDWNIGGVETVIARNVTLLKNAFDLVDTDIIKVPVIFFPESFNPGDFTFADKVSGWTIGRDNGFNVYPGKQGGFQCGALTGDMPNMFVGNDRLMIPKPFGPWIEDNTNPNHGYDLFERDLTQKIAAIVNGPTCDFIDDWDDYHVALGEIHCGTNELRAPYNGQAAFGNARYANWWTAVDA
ncbi:protein-arginine deiminase family protein [Thalassospira lucentensis]|uniref:protein-arginine deiminase family protein n=1 Tax=Thalassospira lucentensis TaxID=168935 RepID=UPI00294399FE|nr:protein-arginine deiminase family protein [Thalassospira lucentensis]WOI09818.1 protein-arginine deiminase family protein [Thalassospira lucentensis]